MGVYWGDRARVRLLLGKEYFGDCLENPLRVGDVGWAIENAKGNLDFHGDNGLVENNLCDWLDEGYVYEVVG